MSFRQWGLRVLALFGPPAAVDAADNAEAIAKSEQMALFDSQSIVGGYTRKDGVAVAPHMSTRKKRLTAPKTLPVHEAAETALTEAAAKHGEAGAHGIGHAARHLAMLDAADHVSAAHVAEATGYHEAAASGALNRVASIDDDSQRATAKRGKEAGYAIDTHVHEMAGAIGKQLKDSPHADLARRVAEKVKPAGADGWSADELAGVHAAIAGAGDDQQKLLENLKHLLTTSQAVSPVDGPKEGDFKSEDGVSYQLRDGRWHRVDEEPPAAGGETAAEPEQAGAVIDARARFDEFIERNGGIDTLRTQIMTGDADQRDGLISAMAAASGRSVDEMAEYMGLQRTVSDGTRKRSTSNSATRDASYQYADTGYIAGARKESAADAIRRQGRAGVRVRYTAIDWEELNQNPREAAATITKGNLFGAVDWESLREAGTAPGAGFLIDRVYASVASEPGEGVDLRDYAYGLDSLRDRLEACKTVDEVVAALAELRAERDGTTLNEDEAAEYAVLKEKIDIEYAKVQAINAESERLSRRWNNLQSQQSAASYEQSRRVSRGWKPNPELAERIAQLGPEVETALAEFMAHRERVGEAVKYQHPGGGISYDAPYELEYMGLRTQRNELLARSQARNKAENPATRAWTALGDRFNAVLNYRRHSGSDAFAKHVATVRAGRVDSWDWAEKSDAPRTVTKQSARFQLYIADSSERVGGRSVPVDSTAALKSAFNLRDVQSGNWVLDDYNSAKFHVENAAAGFADLADLIGVPDEQVSFKGRLGMAFGARGKGGKGAAKAHYESVHRVINITKMAGGGSLAHEWFHFLDNVISEAVTGQTTRAEVFASEQPDSLPPGRLRDAMVGLRSAMLDGTSRPVDVITYTEADEGWAKRNMAGGGAWRTAISSAATAQEAVDKITDMYSRGLFGKPEKPKTRTQFHLMRRIALITKGGNSERRIEYAVGKPMSSFRREAQMLDASDGRSDSYWSSTLELAARAFSSYVEDRLADQGRRNDYLANASNNDKYKALGMDHRPFPEGEERERINRAFDDLMAAVREGDVLQKAMALG